MLTRELLKKDAIGWNTWIETVKLDESTFATFLIIDGRQFILELYRSTKRRDALTGHEEWLDRFISFDYPSPT